MNDHAHQIMQWDCGGQGQNCFNRRKRLKFDKFKPFLPGSIGMTDVDAWVEFNYGHLIQEWKTPGTGLLNTGQRLLLERWTSENPRHMALVVFGDPEDMQCHGWQSVYGGVYNKDNYRKGDINDLCEVIDRWGKLNLHMPSLPYWGLGAEWRAEVSVKMRDFVGSIT